MASYDFDMVERGIEDEPGLPRLTVNNMIKEILPDTKVAKESKDLIINCCSEFIHVVSTEANELAEKSKKAHTLITPDHVIQSLKNLGFNEYVQDVTQAYAEFKDTYKKKKSQPKVDTSGKTQEELQREQMEMFEKARMEHIQNEQEEYNKFLQMANPMGSGTMPGHPEFHQHMPPYVPLPGTQFNTTPEEMIEEQTESSRSSERSDSISSEERAD
ncbi:Protein Dr1-like [Oopsacas minuta]|uniref:Protein Dr1 n=1 Tax=Oopsacas minuta TaxID=111878 RepID=A0AAV7JN11_9METZ|nr:Protein Dr1-like [Oopsacas minuta]